MLLCVWLLGPLAATSLALAAEPVVEAESFGPSKEVARRRGPEIFNAVHNAMRQWGSSLHHNGMSFFLATVPKGVLLHHGNSSPEPPSEPDWLAYEIEHAENFARGRHGRGPGGPPGRGPPTGEPQVPMQHDGELELRNTEDNEMHGYLHVFETTRDLQFLYADGMGGGKTAMGTLDSQDYLLRGKRPTGNTAEVAQERRKRGDEPPKRPGGGGPMDEQDRARDLCDICKEWGLQGVIRMEAGFEIIKCDFSDGLTEVQALQRPDTGGRAGGMGNLEFIRGLSERYQGIGSTRTIIDYSSMVSAYFFPVNLTNPDSKRLDLPRLISVNQSSLAGIKHYLGNMIQNRREEAPRTIDWQDAADIIVGRYADRIKFMAEEVDTIELMAREVNFLLTLFVDYSGAEIGLDAAINRCKGFYLRSIEPSTDSDAFVLTAFETVTHEVCSTLFRVRELVVVNPAPDQSSLAASVSALIDLMHTLNWTRFKKCPPCAISEVCIIPMWPMGTVEDYNHPRCSNGSDTESGERYWEGGPGGPGERPGGGRSGGSPLPPII